MQIDKGTFKHLHGTTQYRVHVLNWYRVSTTKYQYEQKTSNFRIRARKAVLRIRIRDTKSGIRCLYDPWIRDPE